MYSGLFGFTVSMADSTIGNPQKSAIAWTNTRGSVISFS